MAVSDLIKRYSKLNLFIVFVLLLGGVSFLYFFYYRVRTQVNIYVAVTLLRPPNLPTQAPFNWVPYWIGEGIHIGDRDVTPLGGVTAIVVEKETSEGPAYGQYVYLLLEARVVKDRSGVYLFKNKPLSTGGVIDLKLTTTQLQGLITYVGKEPPKYEYKTITLTVKSREVEPWVADNLKIGSAILNSKGEIIAKVIDRKVTPAEVRVDTAGGSAVVSYDKRKRDLEITVEVSAKKIDSVFYFSEIQKIKTNEYLFLPFEEITLNYPISAILTRL